MKNNRRSSSLIILLMILMAVLVFSTFNQGSRVNKVSFNELIDVIENKNVVSVEMSPRDGVVFVKAVVELETEPGATAKNQIFEGVIPATESNVNQIEVISMDRNIQLNVEPQNTELISILSGLFTTILIVGVLLFMLNKSSGAGKGFEFGKNRAKLSKDGGTTTFADVAGCDEEKAEMSELVDYLKRPQKYLAMGARIPKGVLLVGPPGTGKTLLARAIAGEAKVPFYTISGSDFVELFVGVGASRVREMFKEAKLNAPCIIFIDEIDAVGRQRGAGVGGGNDEREQTLNQLLVEMDGFSDNAGIIMIAATNRPDVLDPAILRPGRFDRQIEINPPDKKGRIEILKVHARNKKIDTEIKFEYLAERTPGFTGADLENILNEAALLAVREDRTIINMVDIDEAIDRVIGGPAKKSKKHNKNEVKVVAYHEAGHAVAGLVLEDAEIVQKVTIIPRGRAGGYVLMTPKEETFLQTKSQLKAQIVGLLSGRVAEEIKFNDISTGAHNDIEKATRIARAMVTEYGMSTLGTIQYEQPQGSVFLGRDYNSKKNFSDSVAFEIDQEVRTIINGCYAQATEMLNSHSSLHTEIAEALLDKETLTKEDIYLIYEKYRYPEKYDENGHLIIVSEEKNEDEEIV